MKKISAECKALLRRLLIDERIGGRYTPETRLLRMLRHLHPKERKQALKDWKGCIGERLVLTKRKPTELCVSLNPRKLPEIHALVDE